MTSLRKFSFVLLVVAVLAGIIAAPAQAQVTLSCNASAFPSSLALGSPYTLSCTAFNGTSPYVYTLSGTTPPGMTYGQINGEFVVEGTPTTAGTYPFTIQVTDAFGTSQSQSFTETVGSGSGTGSGQVTITSFNPTSLTAGLSQNLTIFGSGFTSSSNTVFFNGFSIPATYQSPNQIYVYIPSNDLPVSGSASVSVNSGGFNSNTLTIPIGGSGTGGSVSLSSLSQTTAAAGSPGFTLYLYGSGFSQGALVTFGSLTLSSTYFNSGQISVTVPATALTTSQTVNVSVSGSNAIPFTIGSGGSTGGLAINCSPSNGPSASNVSFSQLCTVSGGNGSYTWSFSGLPTGLTQNTNSGSTITISGTPTSIPPYSYTMSVTDTSGKQGTLTITATGSTTGGSYSITSISPSSVAVGSPSTTLIVYGAGFTSASQVLFNGIALPTTLVTSTQLNATLSSTYLTSPATFSVLVSTNSVQTNALTLSVGTGTGTSGVVLSSLSPSAAVLNAPAQTIYLFGSGFTQGQLVTFGTTNFSPTFINSTELSINVPANYFTTAGTISVSVAGSNSLPFIVGGTGSGTLSVSCNPAQGPTLVSTSFSQTCSVSGGTPPYTWTSSGLPVGLTLTYSTGSSDAISGVPTTSGAYTYTLSVTDSSSTRLTGSLTISGNIGSSSYSITSLSPNSVAVNSGGITLTVLGNGFNTNSIVYFNGGQLSTQYISPTQLNATLPSAYLTVAETAPVNVYTTGIYTNSLSFTVGSGSTTTGGTLTVSCAPGVGPGTVGTAFSTTCTASGGTQPYNWVTPANMPAYLTLNTTTGPTITISGTPSVVAPYNFTVKATDSSSPQQTGSLQLAGETNNAGSSTGNLLLTSLSPTSASVNSPAVNLTLMGSGFTNSSQVVFNGYTVVTSFISANQLNATVPAGYLTYPLTALVSVTTPGVGSSNSLSFTIGNGGSGVQMSITCTPGTGPQSPNAYYTANCGVNGGVGPYNWSVSSGSLPSGLTLSPNGPLATINGYTTFNGVYNYTLQVTDSSSPQNIGTLTFAGETGTGIGTGTGLTISSLSPTSAAVGSAQLTLSVFGSNFVNGATVYFNGSALSTTYISATQLNAIVPSGNLVSAQNASITVNSGGVTSNVLTFTVGTVTSTGPLTISCNPTTGPPSQGLNFSSTCNVTGGKAPYTWSGVTLPFGLVLSNANGGASVTLSGSVTGSSYNFSVQVSDSSTTPLTTTYPFVGTFSATPTASITSMTPVSAPSGSGQVTLVLTGSGFVSGVTTVLFGNNSLATIVNSGTQLTATVPANLLTNIGTNMVQLNGTPSNGVGFFVTSGGASGGVSPASLTFTYGIGGSLPAAQSINVTNLGGATGFSATANGAANGVTWLALNQASGAIPGSLSVNIAPGGLPVGTYSGTISLTGFGTGTSVTIPVTLNVVGTPVLTPSTTNLTLNAPTGGSASKTITVTSSDGSTVIPYSISAQTYNGNNWLSVSPTTGTTPGSFTITAQAGNLPPSTYSGIVTLNSTGSLGSQSTVAVTLIVGGQASISASPTSLSFTGSTGQANPAAQTIAISAANNATVNYTVTTSTSSGSGWLSATQSGTTPGNITVSVATGSLSAGTYNGTVTITAPGASNSPITVPVTFTVSGAPALIGNPSSLTFSYAPGGPTPANQTFTVSAPSGSPSLTFAVSATTSSGGNWLSVSPTGGSTQGTVTVSVNPSGLAVGSYNGTVTASASGIGNLVVPVTLNVSAQSQTLSITPGSLTFSVAANGSAPPAQNLSVTTVSGAAANYTVTTSSSGNWLSATQNGTTPGTITVSVNQAGLSLGTYTGSVTVTSPDAGNSPQTITVTLNVTGPPSIMAVPGSLSFAVLADGSSPASQSLSVISTGGNTSFSTSAVSQGGNWLSVGSGGTTPASVAVSVNASGLAAGTYNGSVTINASASNPSTLQVPVTLVVATQGAPAALQAAPTAVYLSYTQGAGTDIQHIAILNSGAGTVNFTATAQTSTCGNWLSLLTANGSATASSPAVLAFNVNPSGISAQTCRGSLSLNDGNGNTTNVPVYMAVSGATQSILLSQTAMNFAASAGGTAPTAQTFQILNPGSGSLQWSINATTLSGGTWLSVSPNTGSSQSLAQVGSPISVSVNPQGLSAGTYYGSVVVTSSGAFNSPQAITVALTVGASGASLPEAVSPLGLVLTSTTSQNITVANGSSNSVTYATAVVTDDGQNWLSVSPASGNLAAGANASLSLSTSAGSLSPGLHHGLLRIAFSDGNVQTVNVQLALSGSPAAGTTGVTACGSSNLAMSFLAPAQNYSAAANVAIPLQVLVEDCSGNQLTSSNTGVDVLVGSTDIKMTYAGSGIWTGTWTPMSASSGTVLTARAVEISGGTVASGAATATVSVAVAANNAPPAVAAVVNAASFLLPGLVSPGAMVSIFGSNLADGQSSVFSVPFPNTLQGAQFTLRGLPLPLFYASNGQVNAVIPTGLSADERDQLLVVRDTTQSAPVDLLVADVTPGIFATNQQGTGQGAILVGGTSQLAAPAGTVPGAGPATAGQYVSIFLSGLGTVTNPPQDGSPSAASNPSTTVATPTVTIGGANATVAFSGLAPGEVGLYQINVQVPAGVQTGNAVPVVVTMANGVSNTVTMAIQ